MHPVLDPETRKTFNLNKGTPKGCQFELRMHFERMMRDCITDAQQHAEEASQRPQIAAVPVIQHVWMQTGLFDE